MDWPNIKWPAPPVLTPFALESLGFGVPAPTGSASIGGATSSTWSVNNKAYFYPFRLHEFATAYQLLFWVGATSSGNIDVGIYDSQLNLIVSAGSTAMSATVNTVQEINITDTVLPPGDYLLGVACSTTAGTCFNSGGGVDDILLSSYPVYEQTTALPLPDPAVPVLCTDSSPSRWVCGIQFVPTF
ncbi:MAG: hypothetical protein Q8Q14_02655 [Gemmatimonadales bacterium]|nr:hypothetical protein [Gemmatimonadales bacterium]